ncbi:hypothetical protein DFQ28_008167 [Apophysomyces sp. BC1034]|nr:hypothetical protein DFQ30_007885 [Apophysomyces sp. BC1015]KAG0175830.1 hypothetical protein DFQ29_006962 [Apophysomyces sp. BC1021]KAG0186218.1 hypothetical protein DFQ28_008167 [Apophysomyces sp. BC1034]
MTYPPALTSTALDELRAVAIDWALAHGLVVRPSTDKQIHFPNASAVTHAPFTLYPSPFPRAEFEKAKGLQQSWNALIHKMSEDDALITEVMETLSQVDDFMQKLYDIYLKVKEEGIAQPASLGIYRCDYLLHAAPGADAKTARIQQVEFNTIAASFGSLSTRTSEMHRYLLSAVEGYADGQIKLDQLPENRGIEGLANGIASAWKLYGKPDAYVLMVTQDGERNAFDQRWLEYNLIETHGVRLMRRSLTDIYRNATLNPENKALIIDGHEIAEWDARLLLERSLSIKCPTVAYQLVGAKKVQQVLSIPGRLERYIDVYTADLLRESFTGLYPLDDSPEGKEAYDMALKNPETLVLKPQREGGGHNFYGAEVVDILKNASPEERNAYILMDLIRSPPLENIMVREGQVIKSDVAGELGIYGVYLNDGENTVVNDVAGHLLRTKAHTTNEGGVAAGFAVIDSPLLV